MVGASLRPCEGCLVFTDRRGLADSRAMAVALAFEVSLGAVVTNVSAGRDPRLRAAREGLGVPLPHLASADFISVLGDETRIIEVKGRGSSGRSTSSNASGTRSRRRARLPGSTSSGTRLSRLPTD